MRATLPMVAGALALAAGACGGDDTDDDVATDNALLVTVSGDVVVSLALIEGADPVAIGVALAEPPPAPLVVTLEADPVIELDRQTVTFTADDFDVPRPVVLSTVDDADVIDGAGALTLRASRLDPVTIPLAIADDDEVALVVDPASLVVMEDGALQVAVALADDPGGEIAVDVATSDAAAATASAEALGFGPADWDVAQTVTVTGVADADALDAAIELRLGGPEAVDVTVPLLVLDVDAQNLRIQPAALALTEEGADGTFTVALTQPPGGAFEIALEVADPALATVSPPTLTFTAGDFDEPQTVTVSPRADLDGVAGATTIVLAATGLDDRTVALTVAEDGAVDLPDLAGEFLTTFRPGLAEDMLIRYRVTYDVDPVAATLDFSAVALAVEDSAPVGDPITATGVAIAADGSFTAPFDGVLPGAANPISGSDVVLDATQLGTIVDANLLCGTATGSAGALPLDGTTWGAVRITGELPAPVVACP